MGNNNFQGPISGSPAQGIFNNLNGIGGVGGGLGLGLGLGVSGDSRVENRPGRYSFD